MTSMNDPRATRRQIRLNAEGVRAANPGLAPGAATLAFIVAALFLGAVAAVV